MLERAKKAKREALEKEKLLEKFQAVKALKELDARKKELASRKTSRRTRSRSSSTDSSSSSGSSSSPSPRRRFIKSSHRSFALLQNVIFFQAVVFEGKT